MPRTPRSFFVALAVIGVLTSAHVAQAEPFDDALVALSSEQSADIKIGIVQLSSLSDERALRALRALRDGKLEVDRAAHRVFERVSDGSRDVASGELVRSRAGLTSVLLNNALRRELEPALARLELRSRHDETRRAAVESLLSHPNPALHDELSRALRAEPDAEIRQRLGLALAVLDIEASDPKVRLSAVQRIEAASDLAFKPVLERVTAVDVHNSPREPDATVRKAARSALSTLSLKETLFRVVGDLLYGLSLASVLLLASLGLAITFGLMGVINMAHGEMLMLGAYAAYVVQLMFQRYAPSHIDVYLPVALPVAFVFCAFVGILIERSLLRFLHGRPLETLLSTWGISLMLIQTIRLVFGAQNVSVSAPSYLSGGVEAMQGVVLPYNRLAIIAFGVLVVSFVWFILGRTRLGLEVRAVTQNRAMAASLGIATRNVDMWTFGIGSGIAGLGGVALSQIGNVGPELGQTHIVDCFMVVVLGGVGKLAGTVAGALGLGIVNKLLEPLSGAVLGKIFVLGFLILFIQKRPQGIFALKGRAVEG